MQLRQILKEDNAVSPVIGVILMVAITVILAAVIATFVLGLGDQVSNTTPQASFSFDYEEGGSGTHDLSTDSDSSGPATNGGLSVTHDGGDSIQENRLTANDDEGDGPVDIFGTTSNDVTAGTTDSLTINGDDTIRIVFTGQSGDTSSTLASFEAPEA